MGINKTMLEISKNEKISVIVFLFFCSFILSFVLIELFDKNFDLDRIDVLAIKYYYNHFYYALFASFIIPLLLIKGIDADSNSFYITSSIVVTIVISMIYYFVFKVISKIQKGKFQSKRTKWLNYLILFICFELWFLIGLIPVGMARL